MNHFATTMQLCKILGIDASKCTGFKLESFGGMPPKLTVQSFVSHTDALELVTQQFELKLIEPPPSAAPKFDLDRACSEALERLEAQINASADKHKTEMLRPVNVGIFADASNAIRAFGDAFNQFGRLTKA